MFRTTRFLPMTLLVVALALVAASSATSAGTDSALCQNGGWAEVQSDHGDHFRSERACLRYVDKGGALYSPRLITVIYCFSTFADLGVFASGFHGASVATLTLHGAVFASDHSTVRTVVTADGSGILNAGDFIGEPTLGGVDLGSISVTLTMRDEQGVTATSTSMWSCPGP
jgi:hypothetical protein